MEKTKKKRLTVADKWKNKYHDLLTDNLKQHNVTSFLYRELDRTEKYCIQLEAKYKTDAPSHSYRYKSIAQTIGLIVLEAKEGK